jgi:hypothetical protein
MTDEGLARPQGVAVRAVCGRLSDPLPAVPYEIADRHQVILRGADLVVVMR